MEKERARSAYPEGESQLLDYWEEYQEMMEETRLLDDYLEEECPRNCDEGEEEAEWLRAAGLGQLTEAWKAGREVQPEELGAALRPLSRAQAEAVKRRVKSLNHTVKQRFNQRQRVRKPDIRDVFKDVEAGWEKEGQASSTGTRSRSGTPDSLDSASGTTPESASGVDARRANPTVPNFVSVFERGPNERKETVRRTPSAPATTMVEVTPAAPVQEIFRRAGHWLRGDVASDTEGIQLTGYQRLGTVHARRTATEQVGGEGARQEDTSADSKDSTLRRSTGGHATVTRSHSSLHGSTRAAAAAAAAAAEERLITRPLSRTSSHGHLSFEEMCRANEENRAACKADEAAAQSRLGVETLSQRELTRLQPLLWLELTAVFDKYNVPLKKRKAKKRRAKAGNLFGVSLSTLLLRDSQVTSEESNVPLVFQKLLNELTRRGVKEEGILRVGGHKQKVESICGQLEAEFYSKPREMEKLVKRMPCHELSAVLKKLLRELPQPLLTIELMDAFYRSHGVKNRRELSYALNLLALLLPIEHRCTLKALLAFLRLVVENEPRNKMSIHNVAMIVAPSLFPPRYIDPRDRSDLAAQVNMAAVCCQVTEAFLANAERLWDVPGELVEQMRRHSEEERYRRCRKRYC